MSKSACVCNMADYLHTVSFYTEKRCGCCISVSFCFSLWIVFTDSITNSKPLSIILHVDSWRLTKTPKRIWTLSVGPASPPGRQASVPVWSWSPAACRGTHVQKKPFRASAIQLRRFLFCSPVDAGISVLLYTAQIDSKSTISSKQELKFLCESFF